jgi:fumarate reductase subunit D
MDKGVPAPVYRSKCGYHQSRMNLGRPLIVAGLALTALGIVILLIHKLDLPLGRLPGDIVWRGKHTTFYFPWVTCLIVSVILSLILWIVNRRM